MYGNNSVAACGTIHCVCNFQRGVIMRRFSQRLVVLAMVLGANAAFAAPPEEAPKKDKEFKFDTDEVTVDVLKPDPSMFEVLRQKARQSLIPIRLDFVKEIVRSAEDL
jgi:hypothetical protein